MAKIDQQYFENLVSGAIRVKQPADIAPIALICFEAHQRGEHIAAWHASAQFYGNLDRCNCVPCTDKRKLENLRPYVSTTAERFAPGNFVTTWDGEIAANKVGVTRAIADKQEANPLVLVKWMNDLSEEWVRSEYLSIAA
jgi:hypothetical protein